MRRRVILASASAGRVELLRRTGIGFEVMPSNCDETTKTTDPEEHVKELALRKAQSVAERVENAIVIGADTVVELDGEILGKPVGADGARDMLARLAGRTHRLLTGLAVVGSTDNSVYSGIEETLVHMRPLSASEIDAYVASGEPLDKSGSYELQGLGATIIDRIDGDFSNVVGLPMAHLARALTQFGVSLLDSEVKGNE